MNTSTPFSEAAMIAIHSLALIASVDHPLQVSGIANRMGFSKHHTASVLRRLSTRSLLKATRGPAGGYMLTERGGDASLLEVIEIFDGSIPNLPCQAACKECHFETCLFDSAGMGWTRLRSFLLNNKIKQLISKKTIIA